MARLRGRNVLFEIDDVEYQGSTKTILFDNEQDELGFGDFADSLKYTVQIEGFQEFGSSTLWHKLWDSGSSLVTVKFAPHGNETATSTQPHFQGSGYLDKLPQIGGTAGEYFVFDLTITLTGKPTMLTTGTL